MTLKMKFIPKPQLEFFEKIMLICYEQLKTSCLLAYYLYLDNDLAIVSTSTKFIRLLVKQLFSLGKGLGSKFLIRNYLFRKC